MITAQTCPPTPVTLLSSGHKNAEWVTSGIGEHVQGLVNVVRPVVEEGSAQVYRSLPLPFEFRDARYTEVVMHWLGHVICRPCCPSEFFTWLNANTSFPSPSSSSRRVRKTTDNAPNTAPNCDSLGAVLPPDGDVHRQAGLVVAGDVHVSDVSVTAVFAAAG